MPAQAFQRKTLKKVNHLKEKGLGDATQSEIDMIPQTLMETMMSKTNSLETRPAQPPYPTTADFVRPTKICPYHSTRQPANLPRIGHDQHNPVHGYQQGVVPRPKFAYVHQPSVTLLRVC
jgi:hypothetical protein